VTSIEVGNVLAPNRLDCSRKAERLRTGRKHMDVIGHQHISVDRKPMPQRGLPKLPEERQSVAVIAEDGATIVPTHDHVVRESGNEKT
jgi:hypothetical protein